MRRGWRRTCCSVYESLSPYSSVSKSPGMMRREPVSTPPTHPWVAISRLAAWTRESEFRRDELIWHEWLEVSWTSEVQKEDVPSVVRALC